jgi:hypothetical protein
MKVSQTEGDEILEIVIRACETAGDKEMLGLFARSTVLLGREVGAAKLKAIFEDALNTAPINCNEKDIKT